MITIRNVCVGLGLLAVLSTAQAAPILLSGDHFTVTYDDVQTGLYKQGYVSGSMDTVYFQPNTFSALSGGAPASTQAMLQLTLNINPGYTFAGLSFSERGDYFLVNGGAVDVMASLQASSGGSAPALLSLAPGSPLTQTGGSSPWELNGNILAAGLGSPQTLILTLDNTLMASAVPGSLGFIQKTYVGFRVQTQQATVPEPASGLLLLAGGLAAGLAGRRRRCGSASKANS